MMKEDKTGRMKSLILLAVVAIMITALSIAVYAVDCTPLGLTGSACNVQISNNVVVDSNKVYFPSNLIPFSTYGGATCASWCTTTYGCDSNTGPACWNSGSFSVGANCQLGSYGGKVNNEGICICKDNDGDGYGNPGAPFCLNGAQTDCNDGNAAIKPGATEVCDGIDNNCNGQIDEGLLNACGTCGAVPNEVCDGTDNDCDGQTDEGFDYDICSQKCFSSPIYGGDAFGAGLFDNAGPSQAVSASCCGDDANEESFIFGTNRDACCQSSTDCVAFSNPGACYASDTLYVDDAYLCNNNAWETCLDFSDQCNQVGSWRCSTADGSTWDWYPVANMPADVCDGYNNDCSGANVLDPLEIDNGATDHDTCEFFCLNDAVYGGDAFGVGLFDNVGAAPGDHQAVAGNCCGDDTLEVFKNPSGTSNDACCQFTSDCISAGRCYTSDTTYTGNAGSTSLCYAGSWDTCDSSNECASGGSNWKCAYNGVSWGWNPVANMPAEVCDGFNNDCSGGVNFNSPAEIDNGLDYDSCDTTCLNDPVYGGDAFSPLYFDNAGSFPGDHQATSGDCCGNDANEVFFGFGTSRDACCQFSTDCVTADPEGRCYRSDETLSGSSGGTTLCFEGSLPTCTDASHNECLQIGSWKCTNPDNNDGLGWGWYNVASMPVETCDGIDNNCDNTIDENGEIETCQYLCENTPAYGGGIEDWTYGPELFDNDNGEDTQATQNNCCGNNANEVMFDYGSNERDACCQNSNDCVTTSPEMGLCYGSNTVYDNSELCNQGTWDGCSLARSCNTELVSGTTWTCSNDGSDWTWNPLATIPYEVCGDSYDNDCNGEIDDAAVCQTPCSVDGNCAFNERCDQITNFCTPLLFNTCNQCSVNADCDSRESCIAGQCTILGQEKIFSYYYDNDCNVGTSSRSFGRISRIYDLSGIDIMTYDLWGNILASIRVDKISNMLTNPSFEFGFDGWETPGWHEGSANIVATPFDGIFSLTLSSETAIEDSGQWQVIHVTPGTLYSINSMIRVTTHDGAAFATVDYYFDNDADSVNGFTQYIEGQNQIDMNSPHWQTYTSSFTAPAGVNYVWIAPVLHGSGTVLFDDIVVSEAGYLSRLSVENTFITEYEYDHAGVIQTLTDPSGRTTSFGYDALGRIGTVDVDVITSTGSLAVYTYNEFSLVDMMFYGLDSQVTSVDYEYDPIGNILSIISEDLPLSESYIYDDEGNTEKISFGASAYIDLGYDELDRLTTVTDTNYFGKSINYTYDSLGNRQTKLTLNQGETEWETDIYTYVPNKNQLANDGIFDYTYNGIGNLVHKELMDESFAVDYQYDLLGNLVFVNDSYGNMISYSYDYQGRKVREQVNADPGRIFIYDQAGNMIFEQTKGGTTGSGGGEFPIVDGLFRIEQTGTILAAVASNGVLALKGDVFEAEMPANLPVAFTVRDNAGNPVIAITENGDLYTTGYLIEMEGYIIPNSPDSEDLVIQQDGVILALFAQDGTVLVDYVLARFDFAEVGLE